MNAEFELKNVAWAADCAKEIVGALLIGWGWRDPDAIGRAGAEIAGAIEQVAATGIAHLVVRLESEGGELNSSVRPSSGSSGTQSGARPKVATAPVTPAVDRDHEPRDSDPQPMVTLSELASRLGVSPWYVQRRLAQGSLPPADAEDETGAPMWRQHTIDAWPSSSFH